MLRIGHDIRANFRTLSRKAGYGAAVAFILGITIASNTVVFSLVGSTVLRALPYRNPEHLVFLWGRKEPAGQKLMTSFLDIADWRRQNQVFERVEAFHTRSYNFTGQQEPLRLLAQCVSSGFFQLLGTKAALGRTLGPEDEFGQSIVLSNSVWKRVFGGDPEVLGRPIVLDQRPFVVVGVMPRDFFFFDQEIDFWAPLDFDPAIRGLRQIRPFTAIARLKQKVTLAQTQSEMTRIAHLLEQEHTNSNAGYRVEVVSLRAEYYGPAQLGLSLLFAAVAAVWLIGCINIANLVLSKSLLREKELAMRMALGASRTDLFRYLAIESFFLAGSGGLTGILLGFWGASLAGTLIPQQTKMPIEAIKLDVWAFAFALVLTAISGVIIGLIPSLKIFKPSLLQCLREANRSLSLGTQRFHRFLVVAELSVSLVLVVGAVLLVSEFLRLQRINPGFSTENLLTLRMIPIGLASKPQHLVAFYEQLLEGLSHLPGVSSVALTHFLPLKTSGTTGFVIEGRVKALGDEWQAGYQIVSRDYFGTMRIPLRKGRSFEESDTMNAPPVAVINETFARRFFSGEEPIRRQLRRPFPNAPLITVVGVVGDVRHSGLDKEPQPEIYYSYKESPVPPMSLVIRSHVDPTALIGMVRGEIRRLDKNLPLFDLAPMQEILDRSVWQPRFDSTLLSVFAVLSLVLALTGIYSVMTQVVGQRTREIGIRMALGAQKADVLKLVVGQGARLIVIGIGVGLLIGYLVSRLVLGLLHGALAPDPGVFLAVSLLVGGVALLACYLPARQATRIQVVDALRQE